jgi:hypothetical protein
VYALREHIETLKTDNEALKTHLAGANARADKAIAALGALADQLAKLAPAPGRGGGGSGSASPEGCWPRLSPLACAGL